MSNYPSRLDKDSIKYIALEGGGGKGNAFVGALEALGHHDLNILRYSRYKLTNILGIAGASAGAITSLFLACGFSPDEINAILAIEDFNAFFDGPHPGRVFRIGGFRTETPSDPTGTAMAEFFAEAYALGEELNLDRMARYIAARTRTDDLTTALGQLEDLLRTMPPPASLRDLEAALQRMRDSLDRLARAGADGVLSAIDALQSFIQTVTPAVLQHLRELARLYMRARAQAVTEVELIYFFSWINMLVTSVRPLLQGDPMLAQVINRNMAETGMAFAMDFGMLTGEEIYNFFRRWLAVARLRVNHASDYEAIVAAGTDTLSKFRLAHAEVIAAGAGSTLAGYRDGNINFTDFEDEFGITLVLTGSNLETFKSHLFSPSTTPNFYVVDAVRLSMALPFCLFKPLIIRDNDRHLREVLGPGESAEELNPVSRQREKHPLIGMWVDGGIFNNIPAHVFDRETGERAGETLGLRLELDGRQSITTINDYFSVFPTGFMFGAGECLSSRSYDNKWRTIELDTTGLGLLTFTVPPDVAATVRQSAIEFVFRYFGRPLPPEFTPAP